MLKKVKAAIESWPSNVESRLETLAKRAREDHVIHCLFNQVIAKAAIKVVANVVMSPLQHIASVESIMKHKPTKNFDFHSAP